MKNTYEIKGTLTFADWNSCANFCDRVIANSSENACQKSIRHIKTECKHPEDLIIVKIKAVKKKS